MRGVLSAYGFDADGPFLVLDDILPTPWQRDLRRLVGGETLTIARVGERHCVGRNAEGQLLGMPCPDRADRTEPSKRFCDECHYARGFNPSFYHALDRISPQQQRWNAEPHNVYLAHFGSGMVKIGMSNHRRELARLLEQGARVATFVARCSDAYEARDIEEAGVHKHGLLEVVRSSQKRRLLEQPLRVDAAKQDLLEVAAALLPALDTQTLQLLELDSTYAFDRTEPLDLTRGIPLVDIDPTDAISGKLRALVGEFLIVEQSGQSYVSSLKELIGYEVAIEQGERPYVGRAQLNFSF